MDVGRLPRHGLGEQRVDVLDDGRVVLSGLESLVVRVLDELDRFAVLHVLHDVVERVRRTVEAVDRLLDRALRGHDRLDLEPDDELDVVDGVEVEGVGHREGERAADLANGNGRELRRHLRGEEVDGTPIDVEVREVHGGHVVHARERRQQVTLGHDPHLHEAQIERFPRRLLLDLRALELIRRDQLVLQKERFESFLRHCVLRVTASVPRP